MAFTNEVGAPLGALLATRIHPALGVRQVHSARKSGYPNKQKGGAEMQKTDSQELTMKKLTLTAWAHILYRKGMIDAAKLSRMTALIDKLKESKPGDSASERA